MKEEIRTPQIRFKGCCDGWKPYKVEEVFDVITDYVAAGSFADLAVNVVYKDTPDYAQLIRTTDLKNNFASSNFVYVDKHAFDFLYRVNLNKESIVLPNIGNCGEVYYITPETLPYPNNVLGPNAILIQSNKSDNKFLSILLQGHDFQNKLSLIISPNGQTKFNKTELKGIEIILPESVKEQDKLGQFFNEFDNVINLQVQKYNQLKNMRSGLLEKMFPHDGAKTPEIRFTGYKEDWKKGTIGDYGDFYYGHSAPKWSITSDARIPCVRYGELYTKFGNKIDKIHSYTNIPAQKLTFSKGTEVLIPRVGEDPMDYTHCSWLSLANVAIGEMISVYNTSQNPLFTAIMFNATLKDEFAKRVEGGSVTNLYYDKLKDIVVSFPSLEEQIKIASLFEAMDKQINKQQQLIKQLQNIKKSFLDKMFVS